MNVLLIAVIAFLLIMAVIGAVRGFARMVMSVAVLAITIILVWLAAPYAKRLLAEHTDLQEKLTVKVTEGLGKLFENDEDLQERMGKLPLTKKAKELILDSKLSYSQKIQQLGASASQFAFHAAVYLILFIVIYLILSIIAYFLEKVADTEGLRGFNRFLGSLAGILEGVLLLDVLALVIVLFTGSEFSVKACDLIFSNEILTWLYNNNLILMLVNRLSATA